MARVARQLTEFEHDLLKEWGATLKKYRIQAGLSQRGLHDLLPSGTIGASHLGLMENGDRDPTLLQIYRFAEALDLSVEALIPDGF